MESFFLSSKVNIKTAIFTAEEISGVPQNMSFLNNIRLNTVSFLILFTALTFVFFSLSCSATTATASEEDALKTLRQMTKDGKLPPESVVLQIENRFPKTRTGALAKLLRARIQYENKNFAGAEMILNSPIFREKTTVGDYALWLRGKSLQESGKTAEALEVYAELVREFPNSLRTREAKLLWANLALASQSGKANEIPEFLKDLNEKNNADALLLTAKSFEQTGNQAQAIEFYRKTFFNGAGSKASDEAQAKLTGFGQDLAPRSADEIKIRADKLYRAGKFLDASNAFTELIGKFPQENTPQINLQRLNTLIKLRRMPEAQAAFNTIPTSVPEKEEGFYNLALGFAETAQWDGARNTVNEMRAQFPKSVWTPKALVGVGMKARDKKNRADESYFLKTALILYPNAVEVAGAQYELAWLEHENKNFVNSSQMLTEHLARYVDKDTTNRGQAGYWAARDSERIGKINEACALYDAMLHRYGANWYGHLSLNRLTTLRQNGKCQTVPKFAADSLIPKAVENLKVVTVAPETATEKELARAENSDELSTIGLFDWAIEELEEARKTAKNSPKINLALAKHYRMKSDNVRALLALKESYPDYYAMTPEEMGREEWDIFYPLTHWNEIKKWGEARNLDPYQIAGFIRQETIFSPNLKSSANAYGMMQLLIPTAQSMARKYNPQIGTINATTLYNPAINIELGTAYMRDQYDKYGRVEYVAVAYNAGPGRVVQWQKTLPLEIDEFVEEIPFRETKGYVQGIIRNSAQYRRLYEMDGSFKANVGSRPLRAKIDSLPSEQFAQEFPEIVLQPKNSAE